MQLGFVVNEAAELVPSMTTAMLIHAAARRGHRALVTDVDRLTLSADGVRARARRAPAAEGPLDDAWLAALAAAPAEPHALGELDALMIRTNPARDPARAGHHDALLDAGRLLLRDGVRVLNHPDGLTRASSKLFLTQLPAGLRMPALATSDPDEARAFADAHGRVVIKPTRGTRGQGVSLLDAADPGFDAALGAASQAGPALIERYLPEASGGDLRVVLVDGVPLEVDGHPGAIRRLPAEGDFRANLHAGGQAAPAELTPATRRIAAELRPLLQREGLWLVGLDLIADQVIELNIYSTGGLAGATRFADGADFAGAIIDRL